MYKQARPFKSRSKSCKKIEAILAVARVTAAPYQLPDNNYACVPYDESTTILCPHTKALTT